jgi:hypothetical protein
MDELLDKIVKESTKPVIVGLNSDIGIPTVSVIEFN